MLQSGASAGIAVDLSLFPLDTLKTRLQSPSGFLLSGGFRNLYKGLGPAMVVKQRSQAAAHPTTPLIILQTTLHSEGLRGMYRGFASTVLREIPFVLLQFPLWEFLKSSWGRWQRTDLYVWQGALCGAVAGGISAAVTTPLDVAKTRIMLAERKQGATREDLRILTTLRNVYAQKGVQGLFAGFTPRVTWITVGGAVFFGVYEAMKKYCCEFSWGHYSEPRTI
uniref:(California timema) hypothetical protein n=1 Tax=Timema californicum TaxID=61474 RepID=A0A7R9P742_TIMCA|nr:unnamed protein product [Timema californicum]